MADDLIRKAVAGNLTFEDIMASVSSGNAQLSPGTLDVKNLRDKLYPPQVHVTQNAFHPTTIDVHLEMELPLYCEMVLRYKDGALDLCRAVPATYEMTATKTCAHQNPEVIPVCDSCTALFRKHGLQCITCGEPAILDWVRTATTSP